MPCATGRRAAAASWTRTVGGGGHAAVFRELGAEVLAVDRDPEAIAAARARLGDTGIRYSTGPFGSAKVLGTIETFARTVSSSIWPLVLPARYRCPGVYLSSRGAARHADGGGTRGDGRGPPQYLARTAAGRRVRRARGRAARAAPGPGDRAAPRHGPFGTSDDLVNAIREARGARSGPSDFARLFQALRIVVNQEVEQLELALPALRATLVPGGRMR